MLNTNTKTTQGLTSKRSRMTLNAKVNSDKERIRMFYLAYQIHTSNCSGLSTILKDISRFSRKKSNELNAIETIKWRSKQSPVYTALKHYKYTK